MNVDGKAKHLRRMSAAIFRQLFIYFLLVLLAATIMFPFVFMFVNSFIGADEFQRFYGGLQRGLNGLNPLHLVPEWIAFSGYHEVFLAQPDYLMRLWRSLFISGSILGGQMIVAILGAYAFACFRFPGRKVIFFCIIALMMMPLQVTLVPNFIVLDRLGLIGSYYAVILPGVFSAFGVFLLRQAMLSIPTALFEAARIDGAGSWRSLWRVCLPNSKPGLSALIILSFADSWNMVEQPLVFLQDPLRFPLSVFLTQINTMRPDIGFVAGILSILPALLLFLYFKDEMVQGIEYSVIK